MNSGYTSQHEGIPRRTWNEWRKCHNDREEPNVNTSIKNKVAKLCKVLFRDWCMYYKATNKKKMEYSEFKMVVILEGTRLDELVIKR